MKTAVVYWSGTGNTESMANLVLEGAKSAGAEADIYTSDAFDKGKVNDYDAIAFGCAAMGAEQLEDSSFEPMFDSVKDNLKGKKIGLFGSYGWGDGEWMRTWQDDCSKLGCTIVNDPVICNGAPDEVGAQECKSLGAALAK